MLNDIYWVKFSEEDGTVLCLCKDRLTCKLTDRKCQEYVLTFSKVVRDTNKKFDVDKATINKLRRTKTELERALRKVKL